MSKQYLTQEGHDKLAQELEELKHQRMPEVAERIARARELGDLSENAEYHDAKDEQGFIMGRITEIEQMLKKAEIIDHQSNGGVVSVGSMVKVRCGGSEFEYTIVGSNEANPASGFISNESPIAQAFLGLKKGDKAVVHAPRGEMECTILEVS